MPQTKAVTNVTPSYTNRKRNEDFTPSERVELAEAIKRRYGERRGRPSSENVGNIPHFDAGTKTREIAAKEAGFGNETTYRQAKTVVDSGVPELVKKMDTGEVSISAAAVSQSRCHERYWRALRIYCGLYRVIFPQ